MRTLSAVLMVLAAGGLWDVEAAIPPVTPLAVKIHRHPDLQVLQRLQPVAKLPAGLSADFAFFDPRAGRITSLVLSEPLIPGTGAGNDLEWATAPMDDAALRDAVWRGVVDHLQRQRAALRLDLAELSPPRVAILAIFVLRTLDPALNPPACVPPNLFDDVPETSPFCRWIEELANRGVVTGCGGGNYCPTANVSREQMSVFLAATFGLALYGP